MTKISDALISDLIQNGMKHNPEIKALSYAVLKEKRRIMEKAAKTLLMCDMDEVTEETLDYLAVELRTPAYSDSYPLETKKELVTGTLPYYRKLGTPSAVNWLIRAIFGTGDIEEWYEYGGEPYHFRAYIGKTINESSITPENITEFRRIVAKVKRLTAWLDEIIAIVEMEPAYIYPIPLFFETLAETPLPCIEDLEQDGKAAAYIAPALGMDMAYTRLPRKPDATHKTTAILQTGSAFQAWSKTAMSAK